MKYVFIVGNVGSVWAWPKNYLQDASSVADKSDRKPWRKNTYKLSPNRHDGIYFGPYNEHGDFFDHLSLYSKQAIFDEIDRGYDKTDKNLIRFALCHQFIYQLDWIAENLPEVDIIFSLRNPNSCYRWWHETGGWDCNHPNYQWYQDDAKLWRQSHIEHKLMQKFVREQDLKVTQGWGSDWFDNNWPEVSNAVDKNKYGLYGAVAGQDGATPLKLNFTNLVWSFYKGKNSTPVPDKND
jgi:hypothetical protein